MKRHWFAVLGLMLPLAALAQTVAPPADPVIPPRRLAPPVPALLQTRAHQIFTTACASCGECFATARRTNAAAFL